MSRIETVLAQLKEKKEKGLILYLTANYPNERLFTETILRVAEWGCDGLEIGVPFSDPIADGPVIQEAMDCSLQQGTTVRKVLHAIASVREKVPVPIIVMTYLNPILRFGLEQFAKEAFSCGVDGVLITDLPADEADGWIATARAYRLDTIFLLSPTSTDERIKMVAKRSTGFIYCVSVRGVTGVRETLPEDLPDLIRRIHNQTSQSIFVGFGISRPDQVRSVVALSGTDGVVVGSAFIRLLKELRGGPTHLVWDKLEKFVRGLKEAARGSGGAHEKG
ncbi:MAG: tryptophan synthase subunit alpha [Armatimonadetes bacterium]|nr:tryptophan synthase subunit alpha [Armatimonadota bacterium]MDW8121757.1 tryptophan synthase subunit alpha [Armatimonadota bacterium]